MATACRLLFEIWDLRECPTKVSLDLGQSFMVRLETHIASVLVLEYGVVLVDVLAEVRPRLPCHAVPLECSLTDHLD